jgi:hypothetical protein
MDRQRPGLPATVLESPPAQAAALPRRPRRPRRPWRRIAWALVALLFLNAILSFSTWWPTPGIVLDARIAPEFVGLWVLLLALVAWRKRLSRRAAAGIAFGYLLLALGRYVDVTVPSLFGRPVKLFWDIPQIPRFLWVTAQSLPWWASVAVVAAVLALFAGLFLAVRQAVVVAAREAVPYALATRWVWAASALAVLIAGANYAGVRATWGFVSKPVVPTYWRQARLLVAGLLPGVAKAVLPEASVVEAAMALPPARAFGTAFAAAASDRPGDHGGHSALAALRGRDVYLLFLESYGAVLYDDPRAAEPMRALRQRFGAELSAGGWQVASAFVRSPTFAGASELAHLGLLSGIDLSDPMRHDVLLTTGRPTLISLFRRAGYRSFGLYPAVSWEWPERAFYGFDVYLEGRTLGYRGPKLGYWWMPDQFSMARLEQLHPRDAAAPPRFVFFPTITTHLPFSPVPPFQPDWQRVLGAEPFDAADTARALAEAPNWTDMFPDYLRMFDYTYRWLGAWLQRPEPREAVYVLLGDHQPAANITGEGASWDVPVHILTRDAALLQRFVAQGFHAGLEPPRAPLGPMHELTAVLLKVFGESAEPAAAGGARGDAVGAVNGVVSGAVNGTVSGVVNRGVGGGVGGAVTGAVTAVAKGVGPGAQSGAPPAGERWRR